MEMMELPSQEVLILQSKFDIGFLVIKLSQEKKIFLPGRYSKRDFRFVRKH